MTTAAITASRETREALARTRHVPMLKNVKTRTATGFALIVLSALFYSAQGGAGEAAVVAPMIAAAWLPAVWLTDKYVHKYPQRYYSYLFASHAKAAVIMALGLWTVAAAAGTASATPGTVWGTFLVFVLADLFLSIPRRSAEPLTVAEGGRTAPAVSNGGEAEEECPPIGRDAILDQLPSSLDDPWLRIIRDSLPEGGGGGPRVQVLEEESAVEASGGKAALVVSRLRINNVRRVNRFFLVCAQRLPRGGYFAAKYIPHDRANANFTRRFPAGLRRWGALMHFLWYRALPKTPGLNALYFAITKGRNRVLSRVEVWGRLSYCGMRVVAESEHDGENYLIAQKVSTPVSGNKRPSYYPVVALEKVGLDGEIVRLHKVRSMYPFSEFLQKRIFEDNGLASTGKFANDFRLTEYGNFIRKYWIDELPQIWDWLRGDIKLVGMRATSRHYLSLYPQELYDLYIQIKPGLIPPIFDEKTDSFDKIVEVEMAYLTSYMKSPLKTDVGLFFKTFTDIFFRGVRSK